MKSLLKENLQHMGLKNIENSCSKYLAYIELLIKWGRVHNLTSLKEREQILKRHVLDSLSVLPFIKGKHCLDVGSGAGLPGIILALAEPEKMWFLLDSNQKKTRFMRHVQGKLKINNIEIIHSRIEHFRHNKTFDTITCRALASLPQILELTKHLLTEHNQLLAMKGRNGKQEVSMVGEKEFLIKFKKPSLLYDSGESSLIVIRRH